MRGCLGWEQSAASLRALDASPPASGAPQVGSARVQGPRPGPLCGVRPPPVSASLPFQGLRRWGAGGRVAKEGVRS